MVPLFFSKLVPVISELLGKYKVDLLFLNNASTDGTYDAIEALRKEHDFVYVISLSNNVGYQKSLECGLHNAKGDIIAFIDVDCEDPPELLLEFVQYHEKGYDIVYGERVDREEAVVVKKMRNLFYHIVQRLADEDIILYMAEFSLISSEVRDAIIIDNNSFPFIRSAISRVGFNRVGIPYKRQRRIAGQTHYNLLGMTVFAVAGILSSTTLPLRLPIYLFPIWLLGIVFLGLGYMETGSTWYLMWGAIVVFAYLGASIAFMALYVARTYKNIRGLPNYVIHRRFSSLQPDE